MSAQNCPRSLKRDYDSFEEPGGGLELPLPATADMQESLQVQDEDPKLGDSGLTTPPILLASSSKRSPSPARSNSSSLSDAGPVTPSAAFDSPLLVTGTGSNSVTGTASPSVFAALNGGGGGGGGPPPAKKTKLTFAEKEMRQIQKKIREQERAEERTRREAERKVLAEEKARREAERKAQAEEKAKREAEEKARKEADKKAQAEEKAQREAEEKAKKEAEKKRKEIEREEKKLALQAAKEGKRRQKEEEKRQAELEKKKKEANQPTLSNFFPIPSKPRGDADDKGRGSMSPARKNAISSVQASPAAKPQAAPDLSHSEISPYNKLFPSFFIFKDVKLANINRFERDEEALHSVCQNLDSYVSGDRSLNCKRTLDAISMFHLPDRRGRRGKRCMPVRQIMAELSGSADTQDSQAKWSNLLNQVPMKFLKFREDVRPPYRGTYTSLPVHGVARLGRNPLRRDLPNTNYDYDSEAEWIEDEDAEDCNSDDEEEEDGEDGEDMEGFLDDENDELAYSKRMVIQGDLEPVSSGLCWEDNKRRSTDVKMVSYRMEMIIDPCLKSVDPFSTQYWESNLPTTSMNPPRLPLTVVNPPNASMTTIPSSTTKPVTSFFAPTTTSTTTTSSPKKQPLAPEKDTKPKKLLPAEDLSRFKEAVEGNNLSKVGLIEVLKKQFPGRPAAAIKGTLETIARRVGAKEADKRWVIVEGV